MTSCKEISKASISYQCEIIADLLDLKDGLMHIQFIVDVQHNPTIVEICRRIPGDLYPKLVEYSTGFPYCERIIESYLGASIAEPTSSKLNLNITRHCLCLKKMEN